MYGCGCEECNILGEWFWLHDSVHAKDLYDIDGLMCWYAFPEDDKKELAHQQGMLKGLEFRYNEIKGTKHFK